MKLNRLTIKGTTSDDGIWYNDVDGPGYGASLVEQRSSMYSMYSGIDQWSKLDD